MVKIKRGKKKKQEYTPMPYCIGHEYIQVGCVVEITSVPTDIKKDGKKLKEKKVEKLGFKPGTRHAIVKAPGNFINSLASVHLKGKDGEIYNISFPFYKLTKFDKNGKKIDGVMDRFKASRLEAEKKVKDTKKAQENLEKSKKKKKKKKK